MPVASATKSEREKKAKALLRFAFSIPQRLDGDQPDASLAVDLRSHFSSFPVHADGARKVEFDERGTKLWNLATQLQRDHDVSSRLRLTLCLLRVFAFYLLDAGHSEKVGTTEQRIRLLKVALRAARIGLGQGELEAGGKVLERAAFYIGLLSQESTDSRPEDAPVLARLRGEYHVLRIVLAWKQNNLAVAEHMYSQVTPAHRIFDAAGIEELADTLYEIGKDLASKGESEQASPWLERALDAFPEQEGIVLSENAHELKFAILHALVKSLLAQGSAEMKSKARDLIDLMDGEYQNKMSLWLMRLEVLATDNDPNPQAYFEAMRKMILSSTLTGPNFKTIMHHLHKMRKTNPEASCRCLEDFLEQRLFAQSDKDEWIERAAVMRLMIGTTKDLPEAVENLGEFLSVVLSNTKKPFNPPAAVAAQTLIWKEVESEYEKSGYDRAEKWCRLALHPALERAGDFNRVKIARKLIMCALARQNLAAAREVYFQMSEVGRDAPQTRYLMYKVANRSGDAEFAAECLDIICKNSSKDATVLYACVIEAQRSDDKKQVLAALKKVLGSFNHNSSEGVHLPALLRCTIRLLRAEMATLAEEQLNTSMAEASKLFEQAVLEAKRTKDKSSVTSNSSFEKTEVDWFGRNSYNLALEYCTKVNPLYLSQLATSCVEFINLLLADTPGDAEELHDIQLRRINCEFLRVCAFTVLGRKEDQRDLSQQHYLAVREYASTCRAQICDLLANIPPDVSHDRTRNGLVSKFIECAKYEIEAAVQLQAWADMSRLFNECLAYESDGASKWETLTDLAIVVCDELGRDDRIGRQRAEYARPILAFLHDIVNKMCGGGGQHDVARLARWTRCVYQIALKYNDELALVCLDQARRIASKPGQGTADAHEHARFPSLELEWLATTAFNRGVDFYCAQDETAARLWADKAMMLAGCADDGGRLLKSLQKAFAAWTWDEN